MTPERHTAVQEIEKEMNRRLNTLFMLAERHAPFNEMTAGYQEIVDLISQKYAVLVDSLRQERLTELEFSVQETALQKQYSQDVANIAVALDRIRGIT